MKKHYLSLTLLVFIMCFIGVSCTDNEIVADRIYLSDEWKLQQSTKIHQDGIVLSSEGAKVQDWYDVRIPSTVMGALTNAGLFPDIMFGTNMEDVDRTQFDVSWWFRTEFKLPALNKEQHAFLNFDGISYYANIWLNGVLIASRDEVYGPFRQFRFDITSFAKENNTLAVEVFRAESGDPNIGFVDWNPRPADESMGIFREVYVSLSGQIAMEHTRVTSKVNTETLKEAWLTIETEVVNLLNKEVNGNLTGKIEGREFSVPVSLAPNERKKVIVGSDEVSMLYLDNPRIWWCNNLGNPELYELDLQFKTGNTVSDKQNITFGVREIKDFYNEQGYRGFILNGKKVLIKSAGWTDDIFLRDTPQTNEIQVQYVKDMNLNSIRFENIWGTSRSIYDLCDRYGLMALVGWSCQWEWEVYLGTKADEFGGIITPKNIELVTKSFEDQVLWLRNHPSIIAWYVGSDFIPRPELEKNYLEILSRIDDRPYVASAKSGNSTVSGPVGMKMAGPYEYVGPKYWFEDTRYGGAYGFNTETGIGAQLPVYESIKKMIPEDKLWPINDVWNYHCTTSTTAMGNLDELTNAMDNKYGKAKNLSDYLLKANAMNYESTKAMFEAFRINFPDATGIVQWMLNSAWPSLYWQLYDYYLIPTSAYYGVKKGNQPQQLIYNYNNRSVYAINECIDKSIDAKAIVRLYSESSTLLLEDEIPLNITSNTFERIFDLPKLETNAFLSVQLIDNEIIAENFYWLSAKEDVHDYKNSEWWVTPIISYADFKNLANIKQASLNVSTNIAEVNGKLLVTAELENPLESIAFFTQLMLKDEKGDIIFPAFWCDNYVSILPGEKRTFECLLEKPIVAENALTLTVSGWNVPEQIINVK